MVFTFIFIRSFLGWDYTWPLSFKKNANAFICSPYDSQEHFHPIRSICLSVYPSIHHLSICPSLSVCPPSRYLVYHSLCWVLKTQSWISQIPVCKDRRFESGKTGMCNRNDPPHKASYDEELQGSVTSRGRSHK